MQTSEVLNKAADLIEERGWGQGVASMLGHGGLCAMGAIALSAFGDVADDSYHAVAECPAGQAVTAYLSTHPEADEFWDGVDTIWSWNDETHRTAPEVIEVLRACAVIEASREREAAEVAS